MKEFDQMAGDLLRRIQTLERKTPPPSSAPRRAVPSPSRWLVRLEAAARTGWATAGAWEEALWAASPTIGPPGDGGSTGVAVPSSGLYRATVNLLVHSTSPGSDALLSFSVNGSPLGPRTKLDPEDLVYGTTGTYYDGASLTDVIRLETGDRVSASLCIQGNPGLSTLAGLGCLVVEALP